VSRETADQAGLAIGSKVPVRGPRGEQALTVRTIYDTADLGDIVREQLRFGDLLVTPADHQRLAAPDDIRLSRVYVSARAGVTASAAHAAIKRALADYPTVEILSRGELRQLAAARIDPALRQFYAMLGLVIVIALFGITNTLALSILERVRELGLLRAIGMDRQQVRWMIRWEAVIVAAIGTAIGLGLGTFMSWAATRDLDLPVVVPVGQLALIAAAVLICVLAATLPARRAGRVDLLHAIATD
jgi:putative ABC transport system permease protein